MDLKYLLKSQAEDIAEIYVDLTHETTPPPSHELDGWKDWETWQASPDIIQDFPYYRMGYDNEGRVGKALECKNLHKYTTVRW